MSAADDRMLDVSLEEVLGGLGPPDVRDPVATAIRHAARRRVATRSALWAAAAAVLVVGTWIALSSGPDPRNEARIAAWIDGIGSDDLSPPPSREGLARAREQWDAEVALLDFAATHPDSWPVVARRLAATLDDALARGPRSRLLHALAYDPRPGGETDAILSRQLDRYGAELASETLIKLHARGLTAAAGPLSQMPRPGLDFLPHVIWLVQRGDRGGLGALEMLLGARHVLDVQSYAWLASAMTLQRSRSDQSWNTALDLVSAKVEEQLGRNGRDAAARLLHEAEWFHARLDSDEPLQLGDLRLVVHRHVAARLAERPDVDAAEIRSRLRRLRR